VIRGVAASNPFVLAPLDGYSDLPFRTVCRRLGVGLCYSEMVPAMAAVHGSRDARRRLRTTPDDHPLVIQVVGSTADTVARTARMAEEAGADVVDFNAGCPSRTVTNGGSGAALLSDLPALAKLLEAVRQAVSVPVTLKVRSGPTADRIVLDDVARLVEDTGMAAVALHARTRVQGYSGHADWSHIARLKERVTVPVIGNGDVTGPDEALRMLRETGCDGVMVGRASIGDPWIFEALDAAWRGLPQPGRPTFEARKQILLQHFDGLAAELGDEETAARVFRKHLARYVRGLPGAVRVRRGLASLVSRAGILYALSRCLEPDPDAPAGPADETDLPSLLEAP
jgi:nifR3 family TIM-barrel protein